MHNDWREEATYKRVTLQIWNRREFMAIISLDGKTHCSSLRNTASIGTRDTTIKNRSKLAAAVP